MKRGYIERSGLSRSEILYIIHQRVSNERDRDVFDRAYLNDVPYEQVAAEYDLSVRRVKEICQRIEKEIEKRICT